MNKTRKEEFAELRRQAEALLQSRIEEAGASDNASRSLPDLIHDLEVHHVELEMQNEELLRTEQRLEASEKKYADLYNFSPVGYFTFDRKGTILGANLTGAALLGMERGHLIGTPFPAYCTPAGADNFYLHQRLILKTRQAAACELTLKRPDGTHFEVQLESVAAQDARGFFNLCQTALIDITDRKIREGEQGARIHLLHLINSSNSTADLIENITRYLKDWTGCDAAGIRISQGPDYPFFATRGFPPNFAALENSLLSRDAQGQPLHDDEGNPLLECMCGLIVRGRFDPARPYFTERGSFWTNGATQLLAGLSALEKKELGPMRLRCVGAGYESMAIVPLRFRGAVLGLLQFNAKREGRFTLRMIAFLERLSDSIAIALAQRQAEDRILREKKFSESLIANSGDGIFAFDRECRYTVWNAEMERMSGAGQAECLGKRAFDVFPSIKENGMDQCYLKTLEGKPAIDIDRVYVEPRTGREFFIERRFSPLRDEAGEVVGGLCIVRDISERKRAADILRRYELLAGHSRDIILFLDRDGSILEVNAAAVAGYGYSREELLALRIHDLRDPGTLDQLPAQMAAADAGGILFETVHRRRDGATFPVEVSSQGATIDVRRTLISVIRDITARKQAEDALRELQRTTAQSLALLDTLQTRAPIGIAFIDRDFHYVRVNEELAEINGIPAAAHLGRTVAEMVPALWPQLEPFYRRVLAGESIINIEISGETAANPGETRIWQASFYPVRQDGEEVAGIGIIILEITARKRAAEVLRRQGEQLVDDDRHKNEFLSMLAHELRNPLAPIRNAVQILRLGAGDEQSHKRQEEMIERQVGHMARLLDDLLDISRITEGKITLKKEKLDLRAVAARALETTMPFIDEHRHTLHTNLPPEPIWLEGDSARLEQVICNLLNNSVKYTETGGQIWVALEREAYADPAPSLAVLRVRDSGTGIAPEMLPRVFEMFTQAERSLDRAQGGLGIGLSLVRRLTEMHGGMIEAHSAGLGQGSEFVVRLPLLPESEAPPAAQACAVAFGSEPASAEPPCRVLVVDDNVDAANSMGELLEIWGYPVRVVYDGAAVLAAALEFKPDIVLLDLGLPGLSGCEVAPLLRAEPSLAAAAIIAVTGYGQPEDRRQAFDAGFDDHFTKPVDLERLEALLRQRTPRG